MSDPNAPIELKQPITIRLAPADKATFVQAASEIGLEPGTAGRQLIELAVQRMRAGEDLLDVMRLLKSKPVFRVQTGRAP